MNREIFKAAILSPVNIFVVICISVIIYYQRISFITLLVLVIFVLIVLVDSRKKLIIEGDILRFQKMFSSNEVSLKDVAHIAVRVKTTTDSDGDTSSKQLVYLLDDSGTSFFSFPGKLVRSKDRARFIESVKSVNPAIEIN